MSSSQKRSGKKEEEESTEDKVIKICLMEHEKVKRLSRQTEELQFKVEQIYYRSKRNLKEEREKRENAEKELSKLKKKLASLQPNANENNENDDHDSNIDGSEPFIVPANYDYFNMQDVINDNNNNNEEKEKKQEKQRKICSEESCLDFGNIENRIKSNDIEYIDGLLRNKDISLNDNDMINVHVVLRLAVKWKMRDIVNLVLYTGYIWKGIGHKILDYKYEHEFGGIGYNIFQLAVQYELYEIADDILAHYEYHLVDNTKDKVFKYMREQNGNGHTILMTLCLLERVDGIGWLFDNYHLKEVEFKKLIYVQDLEGNDIFDGHYMNDEKVRDVMEKRFDSKYKALSDDAYQMVANIHNAFNPPSFKWTRNRWMNKMKIFVNNQNNEPGAKLGNVSALYPIFCRKFPGLTAKNKQVWKQYMGPFVNEIRKQDEINNNENDADDENEEDEEEEDVDIDINHNHNHNSNAGLDVDENEKKRKRNDKDNNNDDDNDGDDGKEEDEENEDEDIDHDTNERKRKRNDKNDNNDNKDGVNNGVNNGVDNDGLYVPSTKKQKTDSKV